MDFVKREYQSVMDEESLKAFKYSDMYQKQHVEMAAAQPTAISMEQIHQAMQNTMNTSIVHNLQLPLSPRQISTLMLKSNQIGRNLNFNNIQYLQRNLNSELDLVHMSEIQQNLSRHDVDMTMGRNLANDLELPNGLAHIPNLEQDLRIADLPQNLSEMGQEIDLSQHLNRHSEHDMLVQERRLSILQDGQVLDHNFAQTLEQNLAHRLDQVLAQRMGYSVVNGVLLHDGQRVDEHMLPMQFHIKSEQEDDAYFYDSMNQLPNVNGMSGQIQEPSPQPIQQDSQLYSEYTNQMPNVPALNAIDLYSRQPYQNYAVTRDNPQNLVVNRQYENTSPYSEEMKKSVQNDNSKIEQPKENLKPSDQNKIYYAEYPSTLCSYSEAKEKNENDPSITNKLYSDDLAMDIKGEYTCYKCQAVFPSKRSLKQHSKSCLEEGSDLEKLGKFSCSQCSYRCQSPAILKIHERTHTGEKPFSCTFCDYKSGQKNNVAKHILVHMKEKPFRCQYCNYRCAQKNNLVVHERTHTGYKPFACPYCDYRTVQKPNLVKHMYLHTDQKPFSCDMCSYKCVQKTNLTKHKQRHLNEKDADKVDKNIVKPYQPRQKSVKCPHCAYKCVQKASLDKHLLYKHNSANAVDLNCVNVENTDTVQNLSVKKNDECQTLSHSVKV
ncbi:zinc finger protein 649 [Amyelois transitella]|uniref:zinc finger protein 649 n=1 Tax=Amyelois transitella TaxID=680683 RepID=UPI00067E3309|nr:zinc finger protein 649 [Amyelois transitella]